VIATVIASARADLQPLHERQQLVAFLLAGSVLLLVLELVRRRKLREEYSWVWVATAACLIFVAWRQDVLLDLSRLIGAASPVSTLFLCALLFLLALVLQFSVRLSRLTHRQRTMGQRIALLEAELTRLRGTPPASPIELPPRGAAAAERDEVA
jgi:hypothetical protein